MNVDLNELLLRLHTGIDLCGLKSLTVTNPYLGL